MTEIVKQQGWEMCDKYDQLDEAAKVRAILYLLKDNSNWDDGVEMLTRIRTIPHIPDVLKQNDLTQIEQFISRLRG